MRVVVGLIAATVLQTCAPEGVPTIRMVVNPKVIRDDGTAARVAVWVAGPDDQPLAGQVVLTSSAGSLADSRSITLDQVGSANLTFTCEAKVDPRCLGSVSIDAVWHGPHDELTASATLKLVTTDAQVAACASLNRRRLLMLRTEPARLQLAVLDGALQQHPFANPVGQGVALVDPAHQLAAFAATVPTRTGTASDEQRWVLAALASVGTVSNPLPQTFVTWDGFDAVRTSLRLDGPGDLLGRLDALAGALGLPPTGLTGAAPNGPFHVVLSVVRTLDGQTSVVVALSPDPQSLLLLDEVAGGSALATENDLTAERCDVFELGERPKVDFIWVVDDSCSMSSSQTAVSRVGQQIAARVNASWLDAQFAGVSTGYYPPWFEGSQRPFTRDVSTMLGWFSGRGAWGTSGSGAEEGFAGLHSFLEHEGPAGASPQLVREGSELHVLFLSDAPEQSDTTPGAMLQYLQQKFPNQKVVAHAIVCPEGTTCGDGIEASVGKYHSLVRATGGVLGSIDVFNPVTVTPDVAAQQAATMDAVLHAVVGAGGFELQSRPISASVRVATSATVGACDNTDVPHDDNAGWRVEPTTGRLVFAGPCVPPPSARVAVSYLSWTAGSSPVHTWGAGVRSVELPGDSGRPDGGPRDGGPVDAGAADAGCDDGGC